jgi:hypothetical protein
MLRAGSGTRRRPHRLPVVKDRVVGHIRAARAVETPEQARERGDREFMALQATPFFRIWACAGVDEILSALHERVLLGSLA